MGGIGDMKMEKNTMTLDSVWNAIFNMKLMDPTRVWVGYQACTASAAPMAVNR